jgi:lipoyl(octanoyl) transferase
MQSVELYDLGYSSYQSVWDLQTAIQQRLIKQKRSHQSEELYKTPQKECEVLLFVEHPHVYTLGKSGNAAHLLKELAELKDLNAEYIEIDRGGDITYHGPGQIVCYPILDLDQHFTDIHKYMRCLEEVVIRTCDEYGIEAGRIENLTGVWIGDAKICAMGVRCSRWVTMHGFAFNVNTDLTYFDYIIPCGIQDKGVTSLQRVLGHQIDEEEVKNHFVKHFENIFKVNITEKSSLPELNNNFLYSRKRTKKQYRSKFQLYL